MGSELSVSAEEESVETVAAAEEQRRPEEPQHKVLFLTEDEAKQPSKVTQTILSADVRTKVTRFPVYRSV